MATSFNDIKCTLVAEVKVLTYEGVPNKRQTKVITEEEEEIF